MNKSKSGSRLPYAPGIACWGTIDAYAITVSRGDSVPGSSGLPYRVVANFFKFPKGMVAGEAAGVAINSRDIISLPTDKANAY